MGIAPQTRKAFARVMFVALVLRAGISPAQTYGVLHNFGSVYRDGYAPLAGLVLGNNTLYGSTASGGTNGNGTLFQIATDGSNSHLIRSFTNGAPDGTMVLISNTLYGTTDSGGSARNGTIFKIKTDGRGYELLHTFTATVPSDFGTNSDGDRPRGDLVTDGKILFGTARYGGFNGNGTVFKINTDGSGFKVIKTFSSTYLGTNNVSGELIIHSGTNLDGAQPIGGLVLNGTTLYGTTYDGGTSNGVVFAMQTDGNDFHVLKYFSSLNGIGTNSDGAAPVAGLCLGGDTLYGVTVGGGAGTVGNVFKLRTNGTDFVNLHDFNLEDAGGFPHNALMLNGSTLYGTTAAGGISNQGTIFMLQTNGTDFTILDHFSRLHCSECDSKFVLNSNVLYGTAADGGTDGGGVVFGMTVLPHILHNTNLGFRSQTFGFDFTGVSNQTAIVEDCTNLVQPVWLPVQTNRLIGSPQHFGDSYSGNNGQKFYRIRSP